MKRQIFEVEADSLASARDLLNARLDRTATMLSEQIICDGEPRTLEGTGDTPEAALEDAQAKMPATATMNRHDTVNSPAERITEVTAYDSEEAAAKVPAQSGGRVQSVVVKVPGRKGILGLGRKPSLYTVKSFDPARVRVTFKPKVKIRWEAATREPDDPWQEVRRVRMANIYDANKKIIYDLQFSNDGNSILAGNQDGSLYFLSGDLALSRSVRVAPHGHTLFSQHPSGAQIAVATGMIGERTITIVDSRTGRTIRSTPLKADWVQYCLDGSILACGASFWKDFKLLRSDSLEEEVALPMAVDLFAISPDRNLIACAGNYELALFDMASRKQIWRQSCHFWIKGLAFAPDGQHVAAGGDRNGEVYAYNLKGQRSEKFEGELFVSISGNGTFSWDGSILAFPASYGVMVCDWVGKRKVTLLETGSSLSVVRFAPSGMRLLAGTWAGTIDEWVS